MWGEDRGKRIGYSTVREEAGAWLGAKVWGCWVKGLSGRPRAIWGSREGTGELAAACVVQGWTPLLTWWLLLQVIGGAGLDVDFSLESPSGVLLINEYRKSDGVHT